VRLTSSPCRSRSLPRLATTSLHLSDPTLLDPSPFHSVITARQRTPPARSLSSDIKAQWNNQVESALGAVRAVEWSHLPSEAAEGVQTVVGLAGELGKRLTGGGDP
jgi:hypothetical protein